MRDVGNKIVSAELNQGARASWPCRASVVGFRKGGSHGDAENRGGQEVWGPILKEAGSRGGT